jgi:glucosamine--fructose-6-phosphate aminotransferase (isomerizing)
MCGIIAGISENICKVLLDGLKQLQNRGYDSAGITFYDNYNKNVITHKHASTVTESALAKLNCLENTNDSILGIAHTRWATHGAKTDINSHPHQSFDGKFVLVHNGIIENYKEIQAKLNESGITNVSETDTENIVNLLSLEYQKTNDVLKTIHSVTSQMTGTWGLVIFCIDTPNTIYATRQGSPLLVGHTETSALVSSEQSGFCNRVQNYFILKNNDICTIHKNEAGLIQIDTLEENYTSNNIIGNNNELTPDPYPFWMIKEINDQQESIKRVIKQGSRLLNNDKVHLGGLNQNIEFLKTVDHIILLGCGTSLNAAKFAITYFKSLCNFISVTWKDGADFSIDDVSHYGTTALILLSQSGETKDLHRCIEIANNHNLFTIGVVNVVDSLIAREVECGCYLHAGREVGVASTKSFTSQCVLLTMIAVWFSQIQEPKVKKNLQRKRIISDIRKLANDVKETLKCHDQIKELVKNFVTHSSCFVLGKGKNEAIANEGALKIKEISYIHAEGYSTSSLKHGPFALLYPSFPVIMIIPNDENYVKASNAYDEIKSREAFILKITDKSKAPHQNGKSISNEVIVPENSTFASLLSIIPIQLLSYELSLLKGYNPDMPRNLAKVVTVE